jgi:predicted CXXCH cytochrome family protein
MRLPADVECCQDCHTVTHSEWQNTKHAEAGVQCDSCHVPHSQQNRMDGEDLCTSCHREIAVNLVHHDANVQCIDCHFSSHSGADASSTVQVTIPGQAPDHGLTHSTDTCASCHGNPIHTVDLRASTAACDQLPAMSARAKELALDLEDAKHTNRNLQAMSVVSLGFGLGTGGILGAVFVIALGFVVQGRSKQ